MQNFKVTLVFGVLALASMISSLQAISVECDYLHLHGWNTISAANDPYGCILRKVDITTKSVVTEITGSHSSGYGNNYVKGLSIYGKVCHSLPSGFEKFFSGIIVMALTETSMKTISSDDLKQFPDLQEFWLYNQLVEYIEPQLFKHNTKLQDIVLKNNKIKYIGSNFFNELPKLTACDLSNNQCGITGKAKNANELEAIRKASKKTCSSFCSADGDDEDVSVSTQSIVYRIEKLEYIIFTLRHELSLYREISTCILP